MTTSSPISSPVPGGAMSSFMAGARDSIGMSFGAMLFGLLFGSAATVAGLTMPQTVSMSAFIFAGTAQFSTLALWQPDMPLFAVAVSVAMVTSRLTLMGLSLAPTIRSMPPWIKPAGVFVINDAAWVLTLQARSVSSKAGYFFGISAPMYTLWVAATVVGVFLAGFFDPVTAKSLAFAGIVFLSVLVGMVVRGVDAPRPPLVVAALVGIALDGVLATGPAILIAVAAGGITALAVEMARDDH